jgi:L,D-transpeptidase ErfK/SrfK
VGTPVAVVNQPQLVGWLDNTLYMQTYPALEDDKRNHSKLTTQILKAARNSKKAKLDARGQIVLNKDMVTELEKNPRALAVPISVDGLTLQQFLAAAPRVENQLPINATWDGDMSQQLTAAEVMQGAGR